MRAYSFTHLGNADLLHELAVSVEQDRSCTVRLLALIAEVDERKLYVPAGYPSMHAYCVQKLHLSEDAASKRIHVARAGRKFPGLFVALAEGRIHLAAACLLAPHLRPANVEELIAASTHRTKAQVEQIIAERLPRTELMPLVVAVVASEPATVEHAPGHPRKPEIVVDSREALVPEPVHSSTPIRVVPSGPPARVTPLAPQRFAIQFTIGACVREKLEHARDLLSHQIPSGDLAEVFERALDALIPKLEKAKFAATTRPRPARATRSARTIPAHVRRAVQQRDQGRCTFVSEDGHRCSATRFLEFDHVDPVARGGQATVEGIRLRCRAHNQYEAERTFGAGFMRERREQVRRAPAARGTP